MYYLKYLHTTEGLSGVSFLTNTWGWATVFLGIAVVVKRKTSHLMYKSAFTYAKFSALAKTFDVGSAMLTGLALTMTSVSQFSSMNAFFPPMILALSLFVQVVFRVELGEAIEKKTMIRKFASTALIMGSAFMLM